MAQPLDWDRQRSEERAEGSAGEGHSDAPHQQNSGGGLPGVPFTIRSLPRCHRSSLHSRIALKVPKRSHLGSAWTGTNRSVSKPVADQITMLRQPAGRAARVAWPLGEAAPIDPSTFWISQINPAG